MLFKCVVQPTGVSIETLMNHKNCRLMGHYLLIGWCFTKNCLVVHYFHPYLGKWSILSTIFFRWVIQPPTRKAWVCLMSLINSAFQKDLRFTTVFYQSEHFILFGQHAADKAPSCRSGGLFDFLRLGVYLPTRYGWWFRNPANQLRWVVFPIICGAL